MLQKRKILIIDDEVDLCLLLKDYFVRKNCEVFISHELDEGVSLIKKLLPDVLFLDNNLPGSIGWEIAPQLAKDYPNMYFVLMSAFNRQKPEMPSGTHFFLLEKPIAVAELDKKFPDSLLGGMK
jgi:DNA-binding response OmpR family regulator